MLVTVCRMANDGADRGDAKLIHKAVQELRYGLKVFAPYRETRKISIFGSSRTPENDGDYLQAVEFARRLREAGWMIITGAGDGIMKAGHGGAGPDASFGVAIRLPFEQKTNDIIADDRKLIHFRYFFTRKLMFIKEASAVALFPGGFGTQDEGFETLTLVQTGKAPLLPIVMIERPGGTYWRAWESYVRAELLAKRLISTEDVNLYKITDSIDDAVREITGFYRVYHSSRYVDEFLVLRLNQALDARLMDRLNAEFAPILAQGPIEQCTWLPDEGGEYPDKPRLKFIFDKRSVGQLRRMVNLINAQSAG